MQSESLTCNFHKRCENIVFQQRKIKAIAIVGSPRGNDITDYAYPCGACRQVIAEFSDKDTVIIVAKSLEDYKIFTVAELLPESFTLA